MLSHFGILLPQILFLAHLYQTLSVILDHTSLPPFGSLLLCTYVLAVCVFVSGETLILAFHTKKQTNKTTTTTTTTNIYIYILKAGNWKKYTQKVNLRSHNCWGWQKRLSSGSLLHVHRHFNNQSHIFIPNCVLIMQSSSGELASLYACVSACRSKVRDKIVLAKYKLLVEIFMAKKRISTCTKLNNGHR